MATEAESRSRRVLGPAQLWGLLAVLGGLVLVVAIALWPSDTERDLLPRYQKEFGFHGDRVATSDSRGEKVALYALVGIDPRGPLGRAGFRAGDAPVAHHGGMNEFAYALRRARCGEATGIKVVQVSQWGVPDRAVRELIVPASAHGSPSDCDQ
jgi:hypothetical protein